MQLALRIVYYCQKITTKRPPMLLQNIEIAELNKGWSKTEPSST